MKNYEAPELLKYAFGLESDIALSDIEGGGGDALPDDEFED